MAQNPLPRYAQRAHTLVSDGTGINTFLVDKEGHPMRGLMMQRITWEMPDPVGVATATITCSLLPARVTLPPGTRFIATPRLRAALPFSVRAVIKRGLYHLASGL